VPTTGRGYVFGPSDRSGSGDAVPEETHFVRGHVFVMYARRSREISGFFFFVPIFRIRYIFIIVKTERSRNDIVICM